MYENTDTDYRFFVNEHDAAPNSGVTPTIYRARLVQQSPDYGGDTWRYYWDGDQMCAVYDRSDYYSPTKDSNPEWTARAEQVVRTCRDYDQDLDAALARLAVRLFEYDTFDARFIPVSIDRGVDLYCLSWDGDPEGTWRDEIEAVSAGDIWQFEVEEYTGDGKWREDDDCEEYYGEHKAEAAFAKAYPLTEFPAHLVLDEAVGA